MFKTVSGKRGDVNVDALNDWKSRILSVCEGYTPSDTFNMDETRIFYKSGKKTRFHSSGSECVGEFTVALCARTEACGNWKI